MILGGLTVVGKRGKVRGNDQQALTDRHSGLTPFRTTRDSVQMKMPARVLISIGTTLACVLVALKYSQPSSLNKIEILAQQFVPSFGSVYVVRRSGDVIDGSDIAFFHRGTNGAWRGYYIAHESRGREKIELQLKGSLVRIFRNKSLIGDYNPLSGTYFNSTQMVTYSSDEGDKGGEVAKKWEILQ